MRWLDSFIVQGPWHEDISVRRGCENKRWQGFFLLSFDEQRLKVKETMSDLGKQRYSSGGGLLDPNLHSTASVESKSTERPFPLPNPDLTSTKPLKHF